MEKEFNELKKLYGNHKAAAAAIGVSYSAYMLWRKNPESIPAWRREWLSMKAQGRANGRRRLCR